MSTNGPTWDDTEYTDGSASSGFKSADAAASEAGGRRRIQTDAAPVPSAERTSARTRRSPTAMIGVMALALVVLIVAIGGSILYFQNQPSAEDLAFRPIDTYTEPSSAGNTASSVIPDTPSDTVIHAPHELPSSEHQPAAVSALYGSGPATTPTSEPKPEPKPELTPKSKPEPKPARIQSPTTTTSDAAAVYVVQVFSSPSRQDADEWLKRLESQQVGDAYLTEQELKGQTWYRVRFGRFSSRVEAEAEALRRGFRQPWIARIR